MNKLYEALEVCLNDIEQGIDVDTILIKFPDMVDELQPLLEASMKAREMAVPGPSKEVFRRNRAKLLQRAAEMREGKISSTSYRRWPVALRRSMVFVMLIALLFVSGTSLVRASSNTLPGDNLYSVKRTWEDVSLFFTLDANKRQALELEHENERLDELHELFVEGRYVNVDFAGYVMRQTGNEWQVSGIPVLISAETNLPETAIVVGSAVRVRGEVNGNLVSASRIDFLPPGSIVPEGYGAEMENEENETKIPNQNIEDGSSNTIDKGTDETSESSNSTPVFESNDETINGIASSIENDFVVIDGILLDIHFAEVNGTPHIGADVQAEGYYDSDGIFIVTKIEFKEGSSVGSEDGSSEGINDNKNGNSNNGNEDDHHNDDPSGDNENSNTNNNNSFEH